MHHATPGRMDQTWKHKAKVLLAFVALCLAAAFSGIGFAAEPTNANSATFKSVSQIS